MELQPWPRLGRYRGKGRPVAASPKRGVPTLPPLAAIIQPGATISRNGDPAALVIERAQVQLAEITAQLVHATTAAERRRLADLLGMFQRLISHMEDRA
jgi:hypothetical protein